MSLEDEVKQAFTKHEDDARADGQSWNDVEKKVRRAHHQRTALIGTLTVVLIAAAGILVPKIGVDRHTGFANPSGTPTGSAAPTKTPTQKPSSAPTVKPPAPPTAIPAGWYRRAGVQSAFQLAIPGDWKGGWFEGTWDFEPSNLPSASQGGDTIFVTVTVQPGDYQQFAAQRAKPTDIQGNRALVWQVSALEKDYAIEWIGCPGYEPTCSSNFSTQTLIARIRASNASLWTTYSNDGGQVVGTIAHYDGSTPVHGTLGSGIKLDEFSRALVRLMDARVEGIGADELMGPSAASFYNTHDGLYELNGKVATGYGVAGPTRTTATLDNFGVTIHYSGGAVRQELITVQRNGAGAPPVITNVCTGCD